jgi:hypothetical protein
VFALPRWVRKRIVYSIAQFRVVKRPPLLQERGPLLGHCARLPVALRRARHVNSFDLSSPATAKPTPRFRPKIQR